MSLVEVTISNDAWLVCVTHAFTTENEEVMGLLLGDIEDGMIGQKAHITAVSVLTRSDKKKDRVEISPEQLTDASAEAERLSEELGTRTRVIGWYHSHPHITVLPSHVDLQTQSSYQMLDNGFVGLIFSCFNKDPSTTTGRLQVTAFQSVRSTKSDDKMIDLSEEPSHNNSQWERMEVPLRVLPSSPSAPNTFKTLALLQRILFLEEQMAFQKSLQGYTATTK